MDPPNTNLILSEHQVQSGTALEIDLDVLSIQFAQQAAFKQCFIHILPFDLIRYIFFLCIDSPHQKTPVVLSSVCRQWYIYTLECPTMWSSIRFQGGGKWKFKWQELLLARSMDAPLDIEIDVPQHWISGKDLLSTSALTRIMRLLLVHLHRWRSLLVFIHLKGMKLIGDMLCHFEAPALESVTLNVWSGIKTRWKCQMFSGGLPTLKKWASPMSLIAVPSLTNDEMIHLREIILDDGRGYDTGIIRHPTIEELVSVLYCCPNLEVLGLAILQQRVNSEPLPPDVYKAVLTELRSFRLLELFRGRAQLATTNSLLHLISYIEASSLEEISCSYLSGTILPVIGTFNPFPNLQRLSLRSWAQDDIISEHDLQFYRQSAARPAFINLSHLQSLIFREQIVPTYIFGLLEELCPELVSLGLSECAFALSDCLKMAQARLEKRRGRVAALEALRIWYSGFLPPPQTQGLSTRGLYLESEAGVWLRNNVKLYDVRESTADSMEF